MILLDYRRNFARRLVSFFRNSRLDVGHEPTLFVALVAISIVFTLTHVHVCTYIHTRARARTFVSLPSVSLFLSLSSVLPFSLHQISRLSQLYLWLSHKYTYSCAPLPPRLGILFPCPRLFLSLSLFFPFCFFTANLEVG